MFPMIFISINRKTVKCLSPNGESHEEAKKLKQDVTKVHGTVGEVTSSGHFICNFKNAVKYDSS